MEEDFCLLGVVTDEPDYKFCWRINREHGTHLCRMQDLALFHPKLDQEQSFPLFCYEDEDARVTYRVIKNRSEHGFFLDELKNLDFLVHIQGDILTDRINAFIRTVSAFPTVRMCVPVDLAKIRNRERLMAW